MQTNDPPLTPESTKEGKIVVSLALVLFVFYLFVVATLIFRWEAVLIGVFWELLMLPSFLLLLALPIYLAVRFNKVSEKNQRLFIWALGLWVVPIMVITILTYLDGF